VATLRRQLHALPLTVEVQKTYPTLTGSNWHVLGGREELSARLDNSFVMLPVKVDVPVMLPVYQPKTTIIDADALLLEMMEPMRDSEVKETDKAAASRFLDDAQTLGSAELQMHRWALADAAPPKTCNVSPKGRKRKRRPNKTVCLTGSRKKKSARKKRHNEKSTINWYSKADVKELVELGFKTAQCANALEINGSVEAAVCWLFDCSANKENATHKPPPIDLNLPGSAPSSRSKANSRKLAGKLVLPPGWRAEKRTRMSGKYARQSYMYYIDPGGQCCRSGAEVERYIVGKAGEISTNKRQQPSNIPRKTKSRAKASDISDFYPGEPLTDEEEVEAEEEEETEEEEEAEGVEEAKSTLAPGIKVDAKFGGGNRYYPGKLEAVNADRTYVVVYNDGDRETSVKRDLIRVKESPKLRAVPRARLLAAVNKPKAASERRQHTYSSSFYPGEPITDDEGAEEDEEEMAEMVEEAVTAAEEAEKVPCLGDAILYNFGGHFYKGKIRRTNKKKKGWVMAHFEEDDQRLWVQVLPSNRGTAWRIG
jgi:hypothetical protein